MPEIPVMPISIYCGATKPASIEQFLRPFVDEVNFLTKNGVFVKNKKFNIKLRAIIANSPSRAFIKGNYSNKIIFKSIRVTNFEQQFFFFKRCCLFQLVRWLLKVHFEKKIHQWKKRVLGHRWPR